LKHWLVQQIGARKYFVDQNTTDGSHKDTGVRGWFLPGSCLEIATFCEIAAYTSPKRERVFLA
jgi:hypothetical protein